MGPRALLYGSLEDLCGGHSSEKLVMSKTKAGGIERNHCRQRHWFGRFQPRSTVISKSQEMADLTMALLARFRVNGRVSEIFTLNIIT